ncbi:type VII secretion protein EccCb [Streptomyces sp. AC512_CC834]|uniref:type VII secretion protein EccCb n=1 Tax=Streptomyces sp. AC512_CC834 TaxID=2823691 RepID=UPI001C274793|nr:type VII secretion protein EccCb [Streptomyces sp. AC512_CC834]
MSRVALLVATTDYIDPELSRLRSPASDARRLAALLEDEAIGYFDSVVPLVNDSKAEIEEHVERTLQGLKPDDTLLLYISCHGLRDRHARLFFTTLRTKRDLPEATAVSARFVEEQMTRCRARSKVLLLDCCFGGTYVQGMTPFAADDGQLSQQAAGKGTYVMTASDRLEFAFEGETVKSRSGAYHSVFTEAVIDGLSTGRADADNDGVITAHELFQHIEHHVKESGAPQTPTEFRSGVQGNIPLAKAALWHRGRDAGTDPFTGDGLTLGDLLPTLAADHERGLCAPDWPPNGQLAVPLGRMYDPVRGLQETLTVDLSGGAPHVGVVGSQWSGKTSVLQTLACSLALTHTPAEVQIYGLHGEPDGLARLRDLPHVGVVADYADSADVRLLVDGVMAALNRREKLCATLRIRSPKVFRHKRLQGALEGESYGEVFLLVDSWRDFIRQYPEESRQLLRVARQGVYYGIHLAVSADRWGDLSEDLLAHLGTWLELALVQPRESLIDSDLAGDIPPGQPGYGLTRGRRYVRLAAPALARVEDEAETEDGAAPNSGSSYEGEVLDDLVLAVAGAWRGPAAVPLSASGRNDDVNGLLDLLPPPPPWGRDTAPPTDARVTLPDPATAPVGSAVHVGSQASVHATVSVSATQPAQPLTAPVGIGTNGAPVLLDLRDASQGGWGPHGLCVGATGSGKSELLRTLVLGLAATQPSDTLNFVLVDFVGTATFTGMERLPHTAAVVNGLAGEPALASRMAQALSGELDRRFEKLRGSGNYANIRDYERARSTGAALAPLPTLLLVIDEFAELPDLAPALLDTLVQVGRVGRSLGVHLLLSTQRMAAGRLKGLDTHLSYRIALRTSSAEESRAVLGVPDAYQLPAVPGAGYLKYDEDHMVGFRVAYSSGRLAGDARSANGDSPMEVVLNRLEGQQPPAHQVWLPPLKSPSSLDTVLAGLSPLLSPNAAGFASLSTGPRLVVTIGIIDQPFEQRQAPLYLDFSGAAGHLQVVGGARSGTSTLLRSLIASFALTHAPDDVQFYGIDLGGGGLSAMDALPHVGGVATPLDPERVRRTTATVHDVLTLREARFRESGVSSMSEYRPQRDTADDPWGDVFLVIDGWREFCQEYQVFVPLVQDIATRGLAYGVHLVLTASHPADVEGRVKDCLGTRLELRLDDPALSELDSEVAAAVPGDVPGRGQTQSRQHFMAAVPRIDGVSSDTGLTTATRLLVDTVSHHWPKPGAPRVRLLPRILPASQLPAGDTEPDRGVVFALDHDSLQPVFLNLDQDPFLLVFGEVESGKSNLLKLLVKRLSERHDEDSFRLFVIDYRISLLDAVPGHHPGSYSLSEVPARQDIDALATSLKDRLPPRDITPQQLRDRSWWEGPDVYVVVDDYDLVATPTGNPLMPLLELLPFARDIGLRLVIACSGAGAGRMAFSDPLLPRLTDLGAQGVVLSRGPDEVGALLGVRPMQLPPGRGVYASRRGGRPLVQVGLVGGDGDEAPDDA